MATKKILIADDYPDNRTLLVQMVELAGYTCIAVENGKEALEVLAKDPYIVLILMDIEMPVMNGVETTRAIRNGAVPGCSKTNIVAITAHDAYDFEKRYGTTLFNDLFIKPYSFERIKNLLAKWA